MDFVASSVRINAHANSLLNDLSQELGCPKAEVIEHGTPARTRIVGSDHRRQPPPREVVAPATRRLPRSVSKNPLHVALSPAESSLKKPSTALVDHARFIDRSRLHDPIPAGQLTAAAQAGIDRNLASLLGLAAPAA